MTSPIRAAMLQALRSATQFEAPRRTFKVLSEAATGCLRRTRHRGEPLLRLGPATHPEEDAFASPGAAAAGTTSRGNGRELGGVPSGWRCASLTATCAVVGRQLVTTQRCTDVVAGYGTDSDLDVIRGWWSLRSLLAIRWLVEHGFNPFLPGCEVDVLRSRM